MIDEQVFYSKILLLGEYSIIRGHKSLALPYNLFSGQLKLSNDLQNKHSNKELKAFCHYLKNVSINELINFDVKSFEFDINHGLFFDSTIPQGHGVGSSGALCASVFQRYQLENYERTKDFNQDEIKKLKKVFAIMESHFHGSSSGLDPLISYLSTALLISNKEHIEKLEIPKQGRSKRAFFLLDTGRSRRTEPLVNLFLEKLKNQEFCNMIDETLQQSIDESIDCFLNNDFDCLFKHFKGVSSIQLENFSPMIPKLYQELWQKGLNGEDFLFKLCGAGGGGFILGLTPDFDTFCKEFPSEQVRVLYRF